jgi:MarR family transcriptional regulator, organic hydroperoxide resistance regulator
VFDIYSKLVYNVSVKTVSKNKEPNPNDYPGFLVWKLANKWEKYINARLKPFGVNQAEMLHLISLFWLSKYQQEVTQTALADDTGVSTMAVSKIIRNLERLGFALRLIGTDPRSKSLTVSEAGLNLLHQTAGILSTADQEFFHNSGKQQLIHYIKSINI